MEDRETNKALADNEEIKEEDGAGSQVDEEAPEEKKRTEKKAERKDDHEEEKEGEDIVNSTANLERIRVKAVVEKHNMIQKEVKGYAVDNEGAEAGDANKQKEGQEDARKTRERVRIEAVVEPGKMMPFWFISLTIVLKVCLTSSMFGYDVKFAPQVPGPLSRLKSVASYCGQALFFTLAVNSWRQDMAEYRSILADAPSTLTHFECIVVLADVWITSPNLPASIAIWYNIIVLRPTNLYPKLKPKYMHLKGVPILPGTTAWLPVLKHVYALLLAPYALLLALVGNALVGSSIMVVFQCVLWYVSCKPVSCCCIWFIQIVLTLALWGTAKSNTAAYLEDAWPFWMFMAVSSFNACIFWMSAFLYGLWVGLNPTESYQNILDYVKKAFSGSESSSDENLWLPFREYQDLSDFDAAEEYSALAECTALPTSIEVGRAKVSVFIAILDKNLDMVFYMQMMFIVVSRYALGRSFLDSVKITLGERKISTYIGSLAASVRSLGTTTDMISKTVHKFWGLI